MNNEDILLKERLRFCKNCVHRKNNLQTGILCGLTDQKPDFDRFCKDYVENTAVIEKERARDPMKLNRSSTWITASVVISIVLLGLKVARSVARYNKNNNPPEQSQYDKYFQEQQEKAYQRRHHVNTINYLSDRNRQAHFSKKLIEDTVVVLNKKMTLKLPDGFYLSIADDDTQLPVRATSRGYYFIYNKVDKNVDESLFQQWKTFRNRLIRQYPSSELSVSNIDSLTTSEQIDRVHFEIKNKVDNIIGVARIIDHNNERYFFQLISDSKGASYSQLYRFLNYYVKIKK
ncbi:hypothetical protein [uncultured Psychroserpens sp.]|uniref:hypothetical protein n=1 Tax=uncultured Psychroserpens sp. TaxID=255436 RepID=UPI002632E52A|nr:hypothetical protein [uncultured Psychroserpens sp.]